MRGVFSPNGFQSTGAGPLYLQLHRRIAEAIEAGLLKPGDSLPPERKMATLTGLSRVTIRKGVMTLVAAGKLIQRRGSGIFVAPQIERIGHILSLLTSFSEEMAQRGKTIESRWLLREIQPPTYEEAEALGLSGNGRVARLDRLRICDGLILGIDRAALSENLLPDPKAVSTSLYALLQSRGRRPMRAIQRIAATNICARDADLLGVAVGMAGLIVERTSYLASGEVVEFTRSIYRSDAYDFLIELKQIPEGGGSEL